jgi:hypothetical protein
VSSVTRNDASPNCPPSYGIVNAVRGIPGGGEWFVSHATHVAGVQLPHSRTDAAAYERADTAASDGTRVCV